MQFHVSAWLLSSVGLWLAAIPRVCMVALFGWFCFVLMRDWLHGWLYLWKQTIKCFMGMCMASSSIQW
jgi:hypothetical protein